MVILHQPSRSCTGHPFQILLVCEHSMQSRFGQLNQQRRTTLPKPIGCFPAGVSEDPCAYEEMCNRHSSVQLLIMLLEDPPLAQEPRNEGAESA